MLRTHDFSIMEQRIFFALIKKSQESEKSPAEYHSYKELISVTGNLTPRPSGLAINSCKATLRRFTELDFNFHGVTFKILDEYFHEKLGIEMIQKGVTVSNATRYNISLVFNHQFMTFNAPITEFPMDTHSFIRRPSILSFFTFLFLGLATKPQITIKKDDLMLELKDDRPKTFAKRLRKKLKVVNSLVGPSVIKMMTAKDVYIFTTY
jgi:hypothetical protein